MTADGIEAVTIREVARRCGVSHGAPRRYFPSRTALLGHLAVRVAGELDRNLDATDESPAQLAGAYVAFATRRPYAFDLLLRHDLLQGSGADLSATTIPLVDRWRRAWISGHPADEPVDALARLAAVHGIASLASRGTNAVLGINTTSVLERILQRTA